MPSLTLKPGRERSLLRRHPWIFSGAVARVDDGLAPGSTLDVLSAGGEFLARAAYSPRSQICARVWTCLDEPVDADFFRRRIRQAVEARRLMGVSNASDAFRLIYAESDRIPGLVVDRYADTLVVQLLAAGAEFWRETIMDLLSAETGLQSIFERSDVDVRELEGLPPRTGWVRGQGTGAVEAETSLCIVEHGLTFSVDIAAGHKTGFYLDQRNNRRRVRELAPGREVLDCFCYSGGFTVNALAGGARSILAVDSSAEALSLAARNIQLNQLDASAVDLKQADVFQFLRRLRDEGRSFDMIVLDPPKFAPTAAYADKAARGYKDINLLAFKLLRPNGILVSFSCSGGIDAGLFQKILASAALDAGVDARLLEHLAQAPDHPIALDFPEASYLKGLVILKVS